MKYRNLIFLTLIIVAVILTYSNHFHNPFQFDDAHTIQNNIYIKSLKNTFLFFKDASTISSNPMNQTYRPLVTLSLAVDYHIAGGLNSFYFHLSMFLWFLVQLVLMFFLFRKILKLIIKHEWSDFIALFAVAWYGLHTAIAETLNYIISRCDSLSTLCVVASLYVFIAFPKKRKFFFYLIPAILGMFLKEQAAMFAPVLFFYILLFEAKESLSDIFKLKHFSKFKDTLIKTLPALIVCGGLGILNIKMQSKTFTPGGVSTFDYFITQPWVYLHYFITFFLPFNLSADSDWKAISNIFDERVIVGFAFLILLAVAAFKTSKKEKTKPIAFGILWFFFALLPTSSLIPLAEVTNDHRMFFPFVGLALSVAWTLGLVLIKYEKAIKAKLIYQLLIALLAVLILGGNACGVRARNKVWSSDESLWYDVTIKSPANGRGMMNYGLSQMKTGNFDKALDYFNRALVYLPYYAYLQVNLGVVKNAMGNPLEAEEHFKKSIQFGSTFNETYYFYAEFLFNKGRVNESLINAERSLSLSPAHLPTRHLLLNIYLQLKNKEKLNNLINETLQIYPDDSYSKQFMQMDIGSNTSDVENAELKAKNSSTPENYLNLSLLYYNQQKYDKCIDACQKALKINPRYPEAYNNICSAYNALGEWDKAIEACTKCIEIKPDFELAKNNLNYAKSQKNK